MKQIILFFKSHVRGHYRMINGKTVYVAPYENKKTRKGQAGTRNRDDRTMDMFGDSNEQVTPHVQSEDRADIEYGRASLVKEGKQNLTNEPKSVSMGAQEKPNKGNQVQEESLWISDDGAEMSGGFQGSIDKYFTTRRANGVAGGPEQIVLTDAGILRAYEIASQMRINLTPDLITALEDINGYGESGISTDKVKGRFFSEVNKLTNVRLIDNEQQMLAAALRGDNDEWKRLRDKSRLIVLDRDEDSLRNPEVFRITSVGASLIAQARKVEAAMIAARSEIDGVNNGKTMNDIGNVIYGGMTIYDMADVAARHGHNRDDAIAKISARPGAWIGVVQNWLEAEKTDRLVQAKQDRDDRWQPNEKQKRVLNLIRSKTRYLNDNDAPMFNHNKKSTLALIRRGLLSRVEYGDFVEYRINEKSKLDPAETAKKVIEWKAKRPKDAPISSPAGWIGGWAHENGVKISDADEVAILGEIKKQIGVMKGDLKSFERQSNQKKEPKIILPRKPKKEK